jgi:hypothetical protein
MGNGKDLTKVADELGEEERRMITRFSVDPGFDMEHVDKNIEDCIRRIRQRKLDEQLQKSGDARLANTLLNEKKKLLKGADL